MTHDRDRNTVLGMLRNLGWPLVLGLAAATIFYGAVLQGLLDSVLIRRYFASHPVSIVATSMFFIGLSALGLKLLQVLGQLASVRRVGLADVGRGLSASSCGPLLDALESLPVSERRSYLGNRLREAVEYVERTGSAQGLDEELKYLADVDGVRQQDSYALVRIIIWATPMLGFLGTVIGITQALGDLDSSQLVTSIQTAMDGLLAGLYIAFDTTALALSLSIILMFVQFFVDRLETQLLAEVDARANEEFSGRFEIIGSADDPHLTSVERMAREVLRSSEQLVARQAELWQTSLEAAAAKWSQQAEDSKTVIQAGLAGALDQFAQRLAAAERESAGRVQHRWEQWQTVLSDNARLLHAHQQEMGRQTELLTRVVHATSEVTTLEQSLNDNLQALAGAKNFEDTVMSLAAAIHLLNTRLGGHPDAKRRIDLGTTDAQGRAA